MKTITSQMLAHLGEDTTTLSVCWKIVRQDGQSFFFTQHDEDIIFDGDTYVSAAGFNASAISNDAAMSVDNLEVVGFLQGDFNERAIRAGLFDRANVYLFLVNWADTSMGQVKLRRGWTGEVVFSSQGYFKSELRGLAQALTQRVGRIFTPMCDADLGDIRCRVPISPAVRLNSTAYTVGTYIRVATTLGDGSEVYENRIYLCTTSGVTAGAQPVYNTTVGATTTDGSAVFTSVQAWTRHAVVTGVTDRKTFTISVLDARDVDGWFNLGVATFETGDNAGRGLEVKSWTQSGGHVSVYMSYGYDIQVGDKLRIFPGCDKTMRGANGCALKFGNRLNFRGMDLVPGTDDIINVSFKTSTGQSHKVSSK